MLTITGCPISDIVATYSWPAAKMIIAIQYSNIVYQQAFIRVIPSCISCTFICYYTHTHTLLDDTGGD